MWAIDRGDCALSTHPRENSDAWRIHASLPSKSDATTTAPTKITVAAPTASMSATHTDAQKRARESQARS